MMEVITSMMFQEIELFKKFFDTIMKRISHLIQLCFASSILFQTER